LCGGACISPIEVNKLAASSMEGDALPYHKSRVRTPSLGMQVKVLENSSPRLVSLGTQVKVPTIYDSSPRLVSLGTQVKVPTI
jgi:hypothetical protein